LVVVAERYSIRHRQHGTSHVVFVHESAGLITVPCARPSSRSTSGILSDSSTGWKVRNERSFATQRLCFHPASLSEEEGGGYLVEFPDAPVSCRTGDTGGSDRQRAQRAEMRSADLEGTGHRFPRRRPGSQWPVETASPEESPRPVGGSPRQEGVSLNTLVTMMIAEGLGKRGLPSLGRHLGVCSFFAARMLQRSDVGMREPWFQNRNLISQST